MKIAFITGCGSGFGAGLAHELLAQGHKVIATDPHVDRLAPLAHPNALLLPLDVRDPAQVREVVEAAIAWSPPNILVNNGGYAVFGSQEEADLEAIRDLFDVNVLGVGRVTQALLPTLRTCSGTIVQLSSVAGRTVFPESGWYAATKYAIEAMSEALFQECATFGIRVRLIEPGSFNTNFLPTAIASSKPRSAHSPYAHLHDLWDKRKFSVLEDPQDKHLVIHAILHSLDDPTPFKRVVVGPDSRRILALRDALPADTFSLLSAQRNGLPDPGIHATPQQVLALYEQPNAKTLLYTANQARIHMHLEHWHDSKAGREALGVLTRLFR